MKKLLVVIGIVVIVAVAGVWYKLAEKNMLIWLPDYISNSPGFEKPDGVTDIIFVVIDHWEPGGNQEILNTWMKGYRELADKHVDADGVKLQHTHFYPIDQFRGHEVDSIVALSREGYGDVEVHLHHKSDTEASLRKKFSDGLDSLQAHGALRSADGVDRWAFAHGNWALDNSRLENNNNYCGVNSEISLIQGLGCYADFTFPSLFHTAQPEKVNKIYYAIDDPEKPKSYSEGIPTSVGYQPSPEQFMLVEGPLVIDWSDWRFKTHPTIEDGNLYGEIPTTFHRFELWLKANIHVEGRPNWVFVRPFTHGAGVHRPEAFNNILGTNIDQMLTEVEATYNDGTRYRLHYMTAREAYNVIKAAEAGQDGNPNDYRNFLIQPYEYDQLQLTQTGR
jgi:hypothetical protein